MIKVFKGNLLLAIVFSTIIGLSGCHGDPPSGRLPSQTVEDEVPQGSTPKPFKIVCWIDKTLSSKETRTESCNQDTFNPLFDALCESGGKLRFASSVIPVIIPSLDSG